MVKSFGLHFPTLLKKDAKETNRVSRIHPKTFPVETEQSSIYSASPVAPLRSKLDIQLSNITRTLSEPEVVRMLTETIAAGIQPVQNTIVMQQLDESKRRPWARFFINRGFKALDVMLAQTAGKYCFGDNITMADLCLVPQVYNANRSKLDMSEYPTISRINNELSKLEAFQKAHPSQQPDCPEDEK